MPPAGVPPDANPRGMILAIVILLLVILGTGILFYQSQEGQIKAGVTGDLTAIQSLKGDQIAAWREDRLYDARVLSSSAFFIEGVDHYLTYGDDESKNTILLRFREMDTSPYYDNVLLIDTNGTVRLSLDPSVTSVSPPVIDQVNASIRSGNVTLTDFYRIPGASHTSMDVIAPLSMTRAGVSKPVGAVLLSINPDGFLYPLIQTWPVPSRSAETLLVEREGDHVLYLNELRHQNNTALNLTIPLTRTDLPAVKAVLGTTGAFVGKDYRGVDVISSLGPVPGSPWFMVAKVDTAEAYSSWQSFSALIIILVAITLGGTVIIVGLLWQRRQKYYYRSLYAAEAERAREEHRNRERLEILLHLAEMESAGEQELADFVLDAGCRLTESPAAFIGRMSPDETVFETAAWSKPEKKDSPSPRMTRFLPCEKAGTWAEAVRKRKLVIVNGYAASPEGESGIRPGYDPVTRYISVPVFEEQRIVMVFTVANRETGYTALDVDNLRLLAQGIWNHYRKRTADELLRRKSTDLEAAFEEITATEEELRANYEDLAGLQTALTESERKYRNLFHFAQVGLFETSFKDATVIASNQRYADLAGFASVEEARGKDILGLYVNPEDRTEVGRILRETGAVENYTLKLRNRTTGKVFWARFSARFNYEREVAEGSIIDITEQKEAEENLRMSEERYRGILDNMQDAYFRADSSGTITMVNPVAAVMYGYPSQEAMIGIPAESLYQSRDDRAVMLRHLDETGRIADYSGQGRRRDGTIFWVSINIRVTFDAAGKIIGSEGVVRDITERRLAEEELQERQALFTRAEKLGKLGGWEVDIETQRQTWTEMVYEIHELDITNRLTVDQGVSFYTPASRPIIEQAVRRAIDQDEPFDLELEIITAKGNLRNVHTVGKADQAHRKVSGFIQDITDRKQAEEEIKSAKAFLDMVIEMSPFAMWISDNAGTATRVNRSLCQTMHLTPDDIVGRYNVLRDTNLENQGVMPSVKAVFETFTPAHFSIPWKAADAGDVDFEGARDLFIEVSLFPILNARGELTNVVCQWVDVTERKTAEDALRESEEKYRVLFTRMTEGCALHEILYDTNGNPVDYRILDVNPAFESVLGIRREAVIGKTSREAYGVDTPPYLDSYAQVAATGQPAWFEVYFAPMQKHFAISVFSPEKGRFATIFGDITDRRAAEELRERLIRELEQKNAELERFTYTVSHDLKSPLITIKGFAGMIEDDVHKSDTLQLKKDVRRIMDAADTMQELLADVLELSRIGRVISPPKKTPFGTIAREAVDLLAGPLTERGVTIDIAPDLPDVNVDHARIREVMVNLIENSLKFLGDRPDPVIRVGVDRSGNIPVFFVQDNGIGINPRYIERIFNLFEKLDTSAPGTGVGLTIVRRIIEVHGGKIWAESEGPGKGTVFRFTLPGMPEPEDDPR